MRTFLLICTILKSLGIIVKLWFTIVDVAEEDHDGFQFCRYGIICMPFDITMLVGLVLATIWLW